VRGVDGSGASPCEATGNSSARAVARTGAAALSCGMRIAILAFDDFNELDSLVAFGILNRIKRPGWKAVIFERALDHVTRYLEPATAE
jgi:hypothetical protein